jgi:hypothetical protein
MRPIIRKRRPYEPTSFGVPMIGEATIIRGIEWAVVAPPPAADARGHLARIVNPVALRQRKVIAAWKGAGGVMIYVPRHFQSGKATAFDLVDIQRELVEAVREFLNSGGAPALPL